MTEGVELVRGIGEGARDIAHLPVALGAFVCGHVATGARPTCNINIAGGDISAICEDAACWDDQPELTSLYRVLHYTPDAAALGPARDGWSFGRASSGAPWMVWAPDAREPVEFGRAYDVR
jgi:hypothetical protein